VARSSARRDHGELVEVVEVPAEGFVEEIGVVDRDGDALKIHSARRQIGVAWYMGGFLWFGGGWDQM